ncbi:DNA-binding NarL/FixJ family response regulator [Crossiella equi]|uniref:DNA-binding NarL/FixJ family response regulator n=1 Tax=Crossiella equi TaxID=130796 RepID=A0ABS5A487_9PSEU|nr:DNA-binding NarL/FixJ family response regulator [Crossiella equi]
MIIADDEPLVRAGIKLVLSAAEDIEVIAEATDGRSAITEVGARSADVLLLDIRMPGMDGLSALAELAKVAPATRVVILTTFGEAEYIGRALDSGAAGFLLKDSAPEELIRAVKVVAAGEAYLSPSVTKWVINRVSATGGNAKAVDARRRLDVLTDREREVLELLAQGLSNADIGGRLYMSEATVKMYVSRVLGKLDCSNRVQAAILAHDAGLGGS